MKIKDIPWYDRPGFRLTREGVEKLTNPELLSLLLTNGEEDDILELSKRYNKLVKGGYNKKPVNSARDVYDMFVDEMRPYKKEVLKVVLLDTKNVPISVKEVSVGTLNSSLIHPREDFKEAIKESANSIILVHNHPSGNCEPSNEDLEVTKKLIELGKLIEIPVIDHIIIADKKFWNWLDQT